MASSEIWVILCAATAICCLNNLQIVNSSNGDVLKNDNVEYSMYREGGAEQEGQKQRTSLKTKTKWSSVNRKVLMISRPNNNTKVVHWYPPPSDRTVNFTSVFDKEIMMKILELQMTITHMNVPVEERSATFEDICFKPDHANCAIESVLQYWQNNATRINETVWDQFHFFKMGDYLDHFLSCVIEPWASRDTTRLNMSCLPEYGEPVLPWDVLLGFDGTNYQNSTHFLMKFLIDNHRDRDLMTAWEAAFEKFIDNYTNPNFTISSVPKDADPLNIIGNDRSALPRKELDRTRLNGILNLSLVSDGRVGAKRSLKKTRV